MKTIAVGKLYFAKVDEKDFDLVSSIRWYPHQTAYRRKNGTYNRKVYAMGYRNGKSVLMHRIVANPTSLLVVDHINGDTLDNRRRNLRCITHAQNIMHQTVMPCSKSGFRGVAYIPNRCRKNKNISSRPWRVSVCKNGKKHHIGYFESKANAVSVYNSVLRLVKGRFATVNKMPTSD